MPFKKSELNLQVASLHEPAILVWSLGNILLSEKLTKIT